MTAVLDYGEIMNKKRLTEKKEQNAKLVYSDLSLKQGLFSPFLLAQFCAMHIISLTKR